MKPSEIFRLKLAIECDGKISHGAKVLGFRICSWIYMHKEFRHFPDDPFPMPWTIASGLLWGTGKKQIYRFLRQLITQGHLGHDGISGLPATTRYHLIIPDEVIYPIPKVTTASGDKKDPTGGDKKDPSSRGRKSPTSRDKKHAPQISISLREENINPMEEIRARSGEVIGGAPHRDDGKKRIISASPRKGGDDGGRISSASPRKTGCREGKISSASPRTKMSHEEMGRRWETEKVKKRS
jgi:hypothetical protein